MEQNQVQTLVVLAEERVGRRVAEDAVEQLTIAYEQAQTELKEALAEIESLQSEKGILLNDVDNLTKKLDKKKAGDKT